MEQLEYFRLFHPLRQADYELLASEYRHKACRKGVIIVRPGEVQRELLLVREGVQMSFFDADDKIHVTAFTYPPNLSAIPGSFLLQAPSQYYLQCLTDSTFYTLSHEALQRLFDQSQEIERLFRKMTEAILVGVIGRHMEWHALSMEERFKAFARRSPHLLHMVPHKYIASYLNIDPTNFSKLFNSVKF